MQKMKRKRGEEGRWEGLMSKGKGKEKRDEERERGKRKVKRRENCEKMKIGKMKKLEGREGRKRKQGEN